MMHGVSGGGFGPPPPQNGAQLTEQQGQKLTELLSNYDAKNLSDEDSKAIVSQIKDLGIKPGAALASALGDAGIDAIALGKQAGVGDPEGTQGAGGHPPPPPTAKRAK